MFVGLVWAYLQMLSGMVLIIGSLVALWRAVYRPSKNELAKCAACSYAVRGVESFTCPECGADLREVGIIPPVRYRMIGPTTFLFLWFLLWGLTAIVLVRIAGTMVTDAQTTIMVTALVVFVVVWIAGMILYFNRRAAVDRGNVPED